MTDTYWRDHAACSGADPRLFDEPSRERAGGLETDAEVAARINRARTLYCDGCPVTTECLADARQARDGGIRAGEMLTSPRARGIVGILSEMCGSEAAYQRHLKHGETPDQACREASRLACARRTARRKARGVAA